jgi:prevent-host-death family protein
MDTNRKGAIAEMKIATAATELGVPVLKPITEHGRYDLAFELGSRLFRVQCKWGALIQEGTVVSARCQSSRCVPGGYVHASYTEEQIDLLAVYCGDLDRCYLLPSALVARRREIWLRVAPPRNAQRACINVASDFEFKGAIAQLGERSAGSRKVGGSNPPSSTHSSTEVGCHQFRNHFGFYLERAAAGETLEISRRGRPYARLVPVPVSEPQAAAGAAAA